MVRLATILILGLGLFLSFGHHAQAVYRVFSDNDGTITNDRGEDATMVTHYQLFRVNRPANSAVQLDPQSMPKVLWISHYDMYRYERLLSQGEGHTGGGLLPTDLTFAIDNAGNPVESATLGHYYKPGDQTFARYQGEDYYDPAVPDPVNPWLEDYKAAEVRTKRGEGTHKGYGYDLMQHFLSSPVMAPAFSLLTFRGVPEEAALEVFAHLKKTGEINELPVVVPGGKPIGLWLLGSPKYSNRFGTHREKKANLIRQIADQYVMTPAREKVLNPDGDGEGYYHTFIIQEDDPRLMAPLVEMAQDITRRHQHRIKFVFRHAGFEEDLETNDFPARDIVIRADGGFRLAEVEEFMPTEEQVAFANGNIISGCARLLARSKANSQPRRKKAPAKKRGAKK